MSPPSGMANPVAWLALAVSHGRQHGGNDGYDDAPDSYYSWDSTVPNHAAVGVGDAIAIWDKQRLLGVSVIEDITHGQTTKRLYGCAACSKARIKPRKRMTPRYKCYACGAVFDDPVRRQVDVTTYRSRHDVGWIDLAGTLSGPQLRALCVSPKSQLSLRPFRWTEFVRLLAAMPEASRLTVCLERVAQLKGGHRQTTVRVRKGQAQFRAALLGRLGPACAVTGPAPPAALEACHLYSYASVGAHHVGGGLLLRRDIHSLFDAGYLAVHPDTLTIDIAEELSAYPDYMGLAGQPLRILVTAAHRRWFRDHWIEHRSG